MRALLNAGVVFVWTIAWRMEAGADVPVPALEGTTFSAFGLLFAVFVLLEWGRAPDAAQAFWNGRQETERAVEMAAGARGLTLIRTGPAGAYYDLAEAPGADGAQ